MKILYFHQYFTTPAGPGGSRSYEFARALAARGHEVTVVTGRLARAVTGLEHLPFHSGFRRGRVETVEVIELDLPYSNADRFVRRALTFLRFALRSIHIAVTERCDLIFATTTPLTAAIPGILGRWIRGRTFVFEVRDLWPELPKAMGVIRNRAALGLMSALEWSAYRSAHRLVALSPGIADGIARRGVARQAIAMIPNGCDRDIFSNHPGSWRPAGVDASDLMAVFTGTHGIANGLDAVLNAAATLKKRGRGDVKLVLVGDGKRKPALVERARTEGLDNVIFHEPVEKTRLAGLMAGANLGMQILANVPAFYYGTSPNKFFDYIASGLPVLINYPGWLADVVTEHDCGYAVPPDDQDAFADALVHAADNRGRLPEMGARGLALASGRFDRATLAAEFVQWIEQARA